MNETAFIQCKYEEIDRQSIEILAEVDRLCMKDALILARDLSKLPKDSNKNRGLATALEEVSKAYCMLFTAYALKNIHANQLENHFKRIIPFCTEFCDDSTKWRFHFLLLIELPSGGWTYLSPGNYSPENINDKLSFDGTVHQTLSVLLMHLEKKFQVSYPTDKVSLDTILKDFNEILKYKPTSIDMVRPNLVAINFAYINYGRITGISVENITKHLTIESII